jgi:hypothetical protein
VAANVSILVGSTQADDLTAADRVEVQERIGEPTTFRLRYLLAQQDSDFPLLTDARVDVGGALTIAGTMPDGTPDVLVKGQVYGQHVQYKHGISGSLLEVCGADATLEMDRDVKAVVHPAQAISDSISGILGAYDVTADVEAIDVTTSDDDHLLVQRDTDLRFLRRLARRYGCWFWVTTDTQDTTTAHFKRPALDDDPTIELWINSDKPTVDELVLDWDVERPNTAVASQLGLHDKGTIDGQVDRSPLTSLAALALADIADPRAIQVTAAADIAGDLSKRSEGALIESGWFVRARGRTNVRTLGAILHAHTLISVGGLGSRHSGTWLVHAVRHVIDESEHAMEFELVRNGWEA